MKTHTYNQRKINSCDLVKLAIEWTIGCLGFLRIVSVCHFWYIFNQTIVYPFHILFNKLSSKKKKCSKFLAENYRYINIIDYSSINTNININTNTKINNNVNFSPCKKKRSEIACRNTLFDVCEFSQHLKYYWRR